MKKSKPSKDFQFYFFHFRNEKKPTRLKEAVKERLQRVLAVCAVPGDEKAQIHTRGGPADQETRRGAEVFLVGGGRETRAGEDRVPVPRQIQLLPVQRDEEHEKMDRGRRSAPHPKVSGIRAPLGENLTVLQREDRQPDKEQMA